MIEGVLAGCPRVSGKIADQILKKWPRTFTMKEPMLMSVMELLIPSIPKRDAPAFARALFSVYARSISGNVASAEQALKIWSNPEFVSFLEENAEVIFPIIYPAVALARLHWNEDLRKKAGIVLNEMRRIDENAFAALSRPSEDDGVRERDAWVFIAREAARLDRGIPLNDKLAAIRARFDPVAREAVPLPAVSCRLPQRIYRNAVLTC
jgi:serine/threonine-protein phosphatase 2A regulatory subunit B'